MIENKKLEQQLVIANEAISLVLYPTRRTWSENVRQEGAVENG
jgi:hypothetical protein